MNATALNIDVNLELVKRIEELQKQLEEWKSQVNATPAPAPKPAAEERPMKVFAKVKVVDLNTGKTVTLKSKLGKDVMSPPAAYGMVKRCRKHPLMSKGYDYKVELIRRPE